MIFGTQFTGSVATGQTRTWFTHSWQQSYHVVWSVIPTSPIVDGGAQLEWSVQSTRQATNLVKWFIVVKNVTNAPVTFQARYAILNA
jgi:hypothetical protein